MERAMITPSFSWSKVRARIWVKAEELFMKDNAQSYGSINTPERCELREGGYFYDAKLLVLKEIQEYGYSNVIV